MIHWVLLYRLLSLTIIQSPPPLSLDLFPPPFVSFSHSSPLLVSLLVAFPLIVFQPPSLPPFFPSFSQCYHPRSDQWTTVSPLPIQRSGFGSAVVDGMLYLAGGCNNLSKVSSVDCYNPEKDEWTTMAPMSIRRSGLGVGVAPAFLFWDCVFINLAPSYLQPNLLYLSIYNLVAQLRLFHTFHFGYHVLWPYTISIYTVSCFPLPSKLYTLCIYTRIGQYDKLENSNFLWIRIHKPMLPVVIVHACAVRGSDLALAGTFCRCCTVLEGGHVHVHGRCLQ